MKQKAADQNRSDDNLLLRLRGIRKSFAGVHALKGVDFDLNKHEVHALVGENGAGKSTLMHIIAGVCQPDEGRISIDGAGDVVIPSERAAQQLGVGMVFQEGSLVNALTVGENVFAGRLPVNRWGLIDYDQVFAQAAQLLSAIGLHVDPKTEVDRLSPAQKQQVEIGKALSLEPRIMIFDEPTSALTEPEAEKLFELIARLRAQGMGIVYISHRLHEIFQIADRISVLKDGQSKGTFAASALTQESLIPLMVGRDFLRNIIPEGDVPKPDDPVVLEVRHLHGVAGLHDVNLSVRAGEVTALAGLAGAGRTELAMTMFGAARFTSGEILLDGRKVRFRTPADAIAAGIGYLPEDRKEAGLFLDMSIRENIVAAGLKQFGEWWQDDRKAEQVAADYCRQLNIEAPNTSVDVQHLSGGNQQKVLLSKWLLLKPRVLIVDEPTRGVDVGAKTEIHLLLHRLARGGTAVLMISSELPEVLAVADRIVVLRLGRITGHFTHQDATEESILRVASLEVDKVA